MDFHILAGRLLSENRAILTQVPQAEAEAFVARIDEAKTVFCGGQGRSGYVLRCFCMRLMHLGYRAFFVGESATPPAGPGDVFVILSGSGRTASSLELVKLAKHHGAAVVGLVGTADSPIDRLLDTRILLPGGIKGSAGLADNSDQPPRSLFEQSAFLVLETIVFWLYKNKGSDPAALLKRHANLE